MAEAARLLLRELKSGHIQKPAKAGEDTPDPFLGLMRDDAEMIDEIVADAYRQRRGDYLAGH